MHLLLHNTESLLVNLCQSNFLKKPYCSTAVNQFTAVGPAGVPLSLQPVSPSISDLSLSPFSSHLHSSLFIPTFTLPDDLAGTLSLHIHHCPYISPSISDTVVRIEFQIPRPSRHSFPSRSQYSPASFPF